MVRLHTPEGPRLVDHQVMAGANPHPSGKGSMLFRHGALWLHVLETPAETERLRRAAAAGARSLVETAADVELDLLLRGALGNMSAEVEAILDRIHAPGGVR